MNILVLLSPSGSMTKELFLDAVIYFIKNLSEDCRKNGLWRFLLLNGHVSRWNPVAIQLLILHRVYPIYFPSHLSIVLQPQDNGVIAFWKNTFEEVNLFDRIFKHNFGITDINICLEEAIKLFHERENKKLVCNGTNSTTHAYEVTGIHPFNPKCVNWMVNLWMYAKMNYLKFNDSGECPKQLIYEVRQKKQHVYQPFTQSEISLLEEAVPNPLLIQEENGSLLDTPLAKCHALLREVIMRWARSDAVSRSLCPEAENKVERLALKYMQICPVVKLFSDDDDSRATGRNWKDRKRDAIISLTQDKDVIQVRPSHSEEDW